MGLSKKEPVSKPLLNKKKGKMAKYAKKSKDKSQPLYKEITKNIRVKTPV